ncbi:unnamed protein product, partial [marine sediment metagenome]
LRAYCYWAIRDALDPSLGGELAIPPHAELIEDLVAMEFSHRSNGKIQMKPKEEIKKVLGRSPDFGDSLANTYYPLDSKRVYIAGGDDVRPSPR